jgi:hypothetical protein
MKHLLYLSLAIALISCEEPAPVVTVPDELNCVQEPGVLGKFPYGSPDILRTVVVDSCEYIMTNGYGSHEPVVTHKGNCKRCWREHRRLHNCQ